MNALSRFGPGFARKWVKAYTAGLPAAIKTERRAEIESDIWEQLNDSSRRAIAGLEIFLRSLLGVPADLTWRLEQVTVGERVATLFAALLGRVERLSGWVVQRGVPGLTSVLAWLFIAGGVLMVVLTPFQAPGERGIAVLGGWGILAAFHSMGPASNSTQTHRRVRCNRGGGAATRNGAHRDRPGSGMALVVVIHEGRRSWQVWRWRKLIQAV